MTYKPYYANMLTEDWEKYFKQFDRKSIDETGKVMSYANQMEEMYQMIKARLKAEAALNVWPS